jgi:hypothetical protein
LASGFFLLNGTPGSSDSWAKAVLNIDSNSRRNSIRFDYENDSALCCAEFFFYIEESLNKNLSVFTEAVKVTVYQKIGHR